MKEPLFRNVKRSGLFYRSAVAFTAASFLLLSILPSFTYTYAEDGALEALQLRYHAEVAIVRERAQGREELAEAMSDSLQGLLQEYLATRDGTIALDTVDDIFVQEQFKIARAMEEPGVALALDVFSGPGTGYENELRTSIANLAEFRHEDAERAQRFVDRDFDREVPDRVSEATLDVMERTMEREMSRIVENLEKSSSVAEHFDSRLDAKLEAKLDAVSQKFAEADRREGRGANAEERADRLREKAEGLKAAAAELAAVNPEKAEKLAEKAEKVEAKAEKVEEKVVDRAAAAAQRDAEQQAQRAADLAAAADRARKASENRAAQAEETANGIRRTADRQEKAGKQDVADKLREKADKEEKDGKEESARLSEKADGLKAESEKVAGSR